VPEIVRWGIVGCGDVVARKSGMALRAAERSELVAVMRRSAEPLEAFARANGVPFWTTDADELICHPQVDAVYVATPPGSQLELALRIAEAGKPCLVEKPVARSAAECAEMVDAFAARGVPLFASYYRPYLPKFQRVGEILRSGSLGPIVSVSYHHRSARSPQRWKQNPRFSGGGWFFDIGGHVLDLLDAWFGPLEWVGGDASNLSPTHDTEDVVSLVLRSQAGAVVNARWNFTGRDPADLLEIEGLAGRLRFECGDYKSPLVLEQFPERPAARRPVLPGRLRRLAERGGPHSRERKESFPRQQHVHLGLAQAVVDAILTGQACRSTGADALRTSRLMDAALSGHYGGRTDAFWERSDSWRPALERRRVAGSRPKLRLSDEELRAYAKVGYVGPFRCGPETLRSLALPRPGTGQLHLEVPAVLDACSDPAIVDRVEQLLGSRSVLLFKSRFWIKEPRSGTAAPWHQDVGVNDGGLWPDGSPIPTVTAWLAIDGATKENGALKLVPGSHRALYGDWRRSINADIQERDLEDVDLEQAVLLEAKAGQFYLFHSWLLHSSEPNSSEQRRAALNMRYVAPGCDLSPDFHYVPVR